MICLLIGTKIGISEVLSTYVYFVQYIKSTTLYYYWFSVKKLPKNMPILTDKRCTMYISYQFGATFCYHAIAISFTPYGQKIQTFRGFLCSASNIWRFFSTRAFWVEPGIPPETTLFRQRLSGAQNTDGVQMGK